MPVEIRFPQITGTTEREQLAQVKSYLYQFAEQLQWAFNNIEATNNTGIIRETPKSLGSLNPSIITSEKTAEATFASIKALIIKSADIVQAYYDEISTRLEGAYVAQSDFGTFVEKTSQEIEQNSVSTTQIFENIQGINSELIGAKLSIDQAKTEFNGNIQDVQDRVTGVNSRLADAKSQLEGSIEELNVYMTGLNNVISQYTDGVVIGVSAYIKSGLLYETDAGIAVYGIEIGQSVKDEIAGTEAFKKYARFTSEKLSFYDSNSNEVAYISDKKLFIKIAHITVALQLGGLISLVMDNGDVVEKWIGIGD